jgi:hypothetical protein
MLLAKSWPLCRHPEVAVQFGCLIVACSLNLVNFVIRLSDNQMMISI